MKTLKGCNTIRRLLAPSPCCDHPFHIWLQNARRAIYSTEKHIFRTRIISALHSTESRVFVFPLRPCLLFLSSFPWNARSWESQS